jgi:uncharacterized protein
MDCQEPAGPAPTPPPASAAIDPSAEAERIVSLDFIRGLALLGILFANVTAYGQPYTAYYWPPALAEGMTRADQWIWLFQFTLVDAKFRGLFTLLFGAGLYLFSERAKARGSGGGLQIRRLLILLLFGFAHYVLLWRGDILALYAVWGLVALPMLEWERSKQLGVGLVLCIAGGLLMTAMMGGDWLAAVPATPEQLGEFERATLAAARAETLLYSQGTYGEIVDHVLREESGGLLQTLVLVGMTETLGLILLGMAFYRYGLFSRRLDDPRLRRWGWLGLGLGVALSFVLGLWPVSQGFPLVVTLFVFNGLGTLPHFLTVLGLVALLARWAPHAARGRLGTRIVAAGRMAFSNYLGMSVVMMLVFHGWALGLFGQLGRLELLAVVAAGWVLILAWSQPWLAAFRYGPLEWLWRCLTYGRLFPLRR